MNLRYLSFIVCLLLSLNAWSMGSKNSSEKKSTQSQSDKSQNQVKQVNEKEKTKKSFIIIKGPEFKGKQTFKQVDILKIAIDEIIKTNKFELIFTPPESWREAKVDFIELIMEGKAVKWGKNREGFNLQFYLVNGKSGKIILKSERNWIPDQRLLFTTRTMLYELFYGKEIARKKANELAVREKAEPEIEAKLEKEEDLPVPTPALEPPETALPPESIPKSHTQLKKKPPRPKPVVEYQFKRPDKPPGVPEESEDGALEEKVSALSPPAKPSEVSAKAAAAKPPPEEKTDSLNKEEKADIKTAEELSEEINKAMDAVIARAKREKKLEEEGIGDSGEDQKEEEKDQEKAPTDQAPVELTADSPPAAPGKGGEGMQTIKTYYMRAIGMLQEIQSQDIVSTTNNFKFIGVSIQALLQFDSQSKDNVSLDAMLTIAVDTPEEFDVPGVKKAGVRYQKVFGDFFFRPIVGLEFELQSFVNLAQVGGGLQVWNSNILWYYFGTELVFNIFSKKIYFGGYLAKSFVGSTDYSPDEQSKSMDGAKSHYYFGTETAFDFSLELHYQVSEMSSQGVTRLNNTEASSYAALIYKF